MMKYRELSVFTWAYVAIVPAKMRRKRSKFIRLMMGNTLSDWVGSGAWSSPIVPLAPPQGV